MKRVLFMQFNHANGVSYRINKETLNRVAAVIEMLLQSGRTIIAITTITDYEIVVWYQETTTTKEVAG